MAAAKPASNAANAKNATRDLSPFILPLT